MRKLLALARRPVVWLSLVAFALWLIVLRATVPPPPVYEIATGEVEYHPSVWGAPSVWTELREVADDGSTVTSVVVHCPGKWYDPADTHPHVWRTSTGDDITPARWADVDGFSPADWQVLWGSALWEHPDGRAFVYDEPAWVSLHERHPGVFAENDRFGLRSGQPFTFSPDARVLAYPSRDGQYAGRHEADGATVEEARTGRRVALLQGDLDRVHLAPGGRVAVSRRFPREGEQPRRVLWDLDTSTVRAELFLRSEYAAIRFTPDGRYVFARWYDSDRGGSQMRWWDTATGKQIGHLEFERDYALTAGGRVLVTKGLSTTKDGVSESCRLCFWDVETGEARGEWDLGGPADESDRYEFACSDGERLLVAEFDPEYGRGRDWPTQLVDQVLEYVKGKKLPEPDVVVVWNTAERREVMRVPGKRPALSTNGRWLATIDEEGVIRVWEVPARLPWTHMLGTAIVAGVGTGVGLVFGVHLVRRCWRSARSGRLRRIAGWVWRSRWRRWAVIAVVVAVVAGMCGLVIHSSR